MLGTPMVSAMWRWTNSSLPDHLTLCKLRQTDANTSHILKKSKDDSRLSSSSQVKHERLQRTHAYITKNQKLIQVLLHKKIWDAQGEADGTAGLRVLGVKRMHVWNRNTWTPCEQCSREGWMSIWRGDHRDHRQTDTWRQKGTRRGETRANYSETPASGRKFHTYRYVTVFRHPNYQHVIHKELQSLSVLGERSDRQWDAARRRFSPPSVAISDSFISLLLLLDFVTSGLTL